MKRLTLLLCALLMCLSACGSQESDALCIIVSEETGSISTAHAGQFHLRLSAEELEAELVKM